MKAGDQLIFFFCIQPREWGHSGWVMSPQPNKDDPIHACLEVHPPGILDFFQLMLEINLD